MTFGDLAMVKIYVTMFGSACQAMKGLSPTSGKCSPRAIAGLAFVVGEV
jgi:hypothetical protein